jgi:hypothetical protein
MPIVREPRSVTTGLTSFQWPRFAGGGRLAVVGRDDVVSAEEPNEFGVDLFVSQARGVREFFDGDEIPEAFPFGDSAQDARRRRHRA